MWSMTTVNVVLAVFSMAMALVALALLAFVVAREHFIPRESAKLQLRDRIKRHESVVVDFRNPATFPEHFLQLNTLMFEKRKHKSNNQIHQIDTNDIIPLPGLDKMSPISEEDEMSHRSRGSFDRRVNKADVSSSWHIRVLQSTSSEEGFYSQSSRSSDADDVEYADVPPKDLPLKDTNALSRARRSYSLPSGFDDLKPEANESMIEPPAREVILQFECGSEYSLC